MGADTELQDKTCISPHMLPSSGDWNIIIKTNIAESGFIFRRYGNNTHSFENMNMKNPNTRRQTIFWRQNCYLSFRIQILLNW